ncbi:TetR family transcriptional regulator [Nocardia panacis]|uniref:TetR family transcriptional regulator n=1 Tax=Nocardia panacis TaxID=2340916 RepID=A0A3A4KN50_9NOCA|nr:TetR family transcriptional regulator [Nocardia panacis]RJO70966.1 TetR family transcriptional regulator [Nocardia panacis]
MGRKKNQEAARAAIVEATLTAIHERGVGALRVRDVAELAGVSTGTVHYYFDDFGTLLREVHRLSGERFFTDRMTMVAGLTDARAKMCAMIRAGIPKSGDDPLVVALYQLHNHLNFRDEHSALLTALYEKQVALYLAILEVGVAQGHFTLTESALDIANNLVALEDAYGLHIITPNRAVPPTRAAALICSYARTATNCPEITAVTEVTE